MYVSVCICMGMFLFVSACFCVFLCICICRDVPCFCVYHCVFLLGSAYVSLYVPVCTYLYVPPYVSLCVCARTADGGAAEWMEVPFLGCKKESVTSHKGGPLALLVIPLMSH